MIKYTNSLAFYLLVPDPAPIDLCNPSPCGSNAECNNGQCTCLLEYHGDPFIGCRPECTLSSDCQRDQICVRKKCVNPCPNTCGPNAICEVVNHIPMCSCPAGYTGNSFVSCNVLQGKCSLGFIDVQSCHFVAKYLYYFNFQHQYHRILATRAPVGQTVNAEKLTT